MYLEKVGVEDWVHWTLELDAREQIKTKTWQRSIWERARGLSQTDQSSGSGSAAVTVRLGFHSHSSPAAFIPSTPPCTNFSLHWVPFICMWSCTSTVSNQTNLAPAFLIPFSFHPCFSSLYCQVFRGVTHTPCLLFCNPSPGLTLG